MTTRPFPATTLSRIWQALPAVAETANYEKIAVEPIFIDRLKQRIIYNRPCPDTRAAKIIPDGGYGTYAIRVCHNIHFLDTQTTFDPPERVEEEFRDLSRAEADRVLRNILMSWKNQNFQELPAEKKNLIRLPVAQP